MAREYNTKTATLTVSATAAGASADVLYTVPPAFDSEVQLLHVINGNSADKNLTIQWFDSSSNTYSDVINDASITAKSVYKVIDGNTLHLHAGDKLVCHDAASGGCQVLVSAKEFFNLTR
tara:strand:+ start:510 stop:869 length:360 start_codon:yes stop_codon:yes gene_type:complete